MSAPPVDHFANQRAEAVVLGCLLEDPRLIPVAAQILRPDHFTLGSHRLVWKALLELTDEGVTVDETMLAVRLSERGDGKQSHLDAVGGAAALLEYRQSGFSPATQFEPSVRTITERLARRHLKHALDTASMKLGEGSETSSVLDELNAMVAQLDEPGLENDELAYASTIARAVMADLERGPDAKPSTLATGIQPVDALLDGGFALGMHYIVGALSGHGKTTFASALVAGLLEQNPDLVVDWYGCEVPAKWQFCRIASAWADLPERFWRKPEENSARAYKRAVEAIGWGMRLDSRLRIFHCSGEIDMRDVALKTAVRRRALDGQPLLVVVDYLQRSAAGPRNAGITERIAEASRVHAGLADDSTITLALSQFTDAPTNTEPIPMPKPTMARWAKEIHHDACDWLTYHRPMPEGLPPLAIVQLAKSRYGRLAHVNLLGTPSNRFENFRAPGTEVIRQCEQLYNVNITAQQAPKPQGLNTMEIRV